MNNANKKIALISDYFNLYLITLFIIFIKNQLFSDYLENWKLDNPTSINDSAVKRFKQIIYMLSNYTYSKYAINKGYNDDIKLIAPYYFELISTPNPKEEGYWKFEHCKVQLNSSYFNFGGGPIPPEPINYWKEVYAQEKPFNQVDNKYYFVVWKTNNWNITKFKNNTLIDRWHPSIKLDSKNEDENYELNLEWKSPITTIVIRSYSVISGWPAPRFKYVYLWNSDSEPNAPIINIKTGEITNWNLKNQSISINNNNNKNDEIKVTVKNKDISENPIYQLEANFFNWLSITNELETNNIPSLIPAEIKLSDGEYGKYLTSLIVSNDKIEKYLNYFSQLYRLFYSKAAWISLTKNLAEDNIKITFNKKLFNLNQIEISGLWGYGNYNITIFTEKEQININNLELFDKNNEKLSLIRLEI